MRDALYRLVRVTAAAAIVEEGLSAVATTTQVKMGADRDTLIAALNAFHQKESGGGGSGGGGECGEGSPSKPRCAQHTANSGTRGATPEADEAVSRLGQLALITGAGNPKDRQTLQVIADRSAMLAKRATVAMTHRAPSMSKLNGHIEAGTRAMRGREAAQITLLLRDLPNRLKEARECNVEAPLIAKASKMVDKLVAVQALIPLHVLAQAALPPFGKDGSGSRVKNESGWARLDAAIPPLRAAIEEARAAEVESAVVSKDAKLVSQMERCAG